MHDQLSKLREWSWKPDGTGEGTRFPCTKMSVEFTHSLAKHKYFGANGASIENTGRDEINFTAEIPFRSNIATAKNETWAQLYPGEFRTFLAIAKEREIGTLTHPDLGPVRARLESVKILYEADRRDGCDVSVKWVEDREPTDADVLQDIQALRAVSAISLDKAVRDYQLDPQLASESPFATIERLFSAAATVGDRSYLAAFRVSQLASRLSAKVIRVTESFERLSAADQLLNNDIRRGLAQLESKAHSIRRTSASSSTIVYYTTPRKMSLSQVALEIRADVQTLAQMNPSLIRKHTIDVGTTLRCMK